MMKITLITATFNSIQHLPSVIESIQQQTYPNIEYIVIDGGSTDGSVEYLRQSGVVTQIITEPDKGIYDALNKGIKIATGELIGFLHSADRLASPQTIENLIHAFFPSDFPHLQSLIVNPSRVLGINPPSPHLPLSLSPDVVYGDLVFIDPHEPNKVLRYWRSRPFKPGLLYQGWMPAHPTVFMRREVYEKHGLYNIHLKCASDYDYMLRIFRDTTLTFCYLREVITKMSRGGISNSGLKNLLNKRKEDYWVLKNNKMPFPLWILFAKNVSKIPQLFRRK